MIAIYSIFKFFKGKIPKNAEGIYSIEFLILL